MKPDPDLSFPDTKYWIANDFDRPAERLIAERRSDGRFYYVHPSICKEKAYHGMTPTNPTPLDAFGIEWTEEEGFLFGALARPSTATYQDGRIREWQDYHNFHFKLP